MAADESVVAAVFEDLHSRPLEVVELNSFANDADKLLRTDELDELRGELAELRQLGDVIPDSGGLRKFRWAQRVRASVVGFEWSTTTAVTTCRFS